MKELKDLVRKAREKGVVTIEAEYSGSGDEGFIDQIYAITRSGARIEDIAAMAETALYDLLERYYAGWENNEGGYGRIVIDVNKGSYQILHNNYVTTTESDEIQGEVFD